MGKGSREQEREEGRGGKGRKEKWKEIFNNDFCAWILCIPQRYMCYKFESQLGLLSSWGLVGDHEVSMCSLTFYLPLSLLSYEVSMLLYCTLLSEATSSNKANQLWFRTYKTLKLTSAFPLIYLLLSYISSIRENQHTYFKFFSVLSLHNGNHFLH